MAKRIKVKGKAPRGLSKAQRIVRGADATFKGESRLVNKHRERENYKGELVGMPDWLADSHIETLAGLRDYAHLSPEAMRGQTKPSSTRKKRVKEGNQKFVGPRTLKSEISEDAATRFRESFGPSRTGKATPAYVMRNVGEKGNLPRIPKTKKKKTASSADSQIKTLIALKRLSESGQLPEEVGRMLRDIPGI